jgi:hypothetical protein
MPPAVSNADSQAQRAADCATPEDAAPKAARRRRRKPSAKTTADAPRAETRKRQREARSQQPPAVTAAQPGIQPQPADAHDDQPPAVTAAQPGIQEQRAEAHEEQRGDTSARNVNEARPAGTGEADLEAIHADAALVERCVAGEVAAWTELYERCHPALLRSLAYMLGRLPRDPELIDDLAAQVWEALIDNDGELLARFDAERNAQLGTFLRAVARDRVRMYLRAEKRRIERELAACRERPRPYDTGPDETGAALADFRQRLTAGEQEYLDECLLGLGDDDADGADDDPRRGRARLWQFASRLRRKLHKFLGDGQP